MPIVLLLVKELFSFLGGKLPERAGRKVTGLRLTGYDSGIAELEALVPEAGLAFCL